MKIKFKIDVSSGKCDGKSVVAVKDRLVEVRALGAEIPMLSGYAYGSNAIYDQVADKIHEAYDNLCAEVAAEGCTTEWLNGHTLVLRGATVEDAAVKSFADGLGRLACVCVSVSNSNNIKPERR